MGLLLKLGSMRSAWRLLDSNGSGSLSYTEFVDGIERTKVRVAPLVQVTISSKSICIYTPFLASRPVETAQARSRTPNS